MLDHIAINVKNIAESVSWYTQRFGFEVAYIDDTWAMMKKGDLKLALTISRQHPPHIAFRVEREEDLPEDNPREHRDKTKYVYETDPDGNVIEWIWYPEELT